jgi:hypothetical protein
MKKNWIVEKIINITPYAVIIIKVVSQGLVK